MINLSVIGRLGADAEVVDGKNGKFVKFRMATDDKRKGKVETSWFSVILDGDRFLKVAEYLKKGKLVFVTGFESIELYNANDGTTKFSRNISGNNIEFISSGNNSGNTTSETEVTVGTFKPKTEEKVEVPITKESFPPTQPSSDDNNDYDLPF